jgi:hypothetical protein
MKIAARLVEAFFTFQLFLSPALIGGLIGTCVYLSADNDLLLCVAYGIWVLGCALGILFAYKVKKKEAATKFLGRIISTPELDKSPGEAK